MKVISMIYKKIKQNLRLPSFANLISFSFLLLLTSCIIPLPYFPDNEPCQLSIKAGSFGLYQKPDPDMEQEYSKYDSISYGFFIQNEIFVDGDPNCGKILVLDSIKNIQIITLRKYNSIYDSLDTITSNFKVYLFQPDTNSWSFYNSIEECFNKSGNIPADRDLKLKLISPPTLCPIYVLPETGDTIYAARTIQFKFILYLTDSRKFELISKPIFAIP